MRIYLFFIESITQKIGYIIYAKSLTNVFMPSFEQY